MDREHGVRAGAGVIHLVSSRVPLLVAQFYNLHRLLDRLDICLHNPGDLVLSAAGDNLQGLRRMLFGALQIVQLVAVDLHVGNLYLRVLPHAPVEDVEELLQYPRQQPPRVALAASDGVRLPAPRVPVGDDRAVVAAEDGAQDLFSDPSEDIGLRRRLGKAMIEHRNPLPNPFAWPPSPRPRSVKNRRRIVLERQAFLFHLRLPLRHERPDAHVDVDTVDDALVRLLAVGLALPFLLHVQLLCLLYDGESGRAPCLEVRLVVEIQPPEEQLRTASVQVPARPALPFLDRDVVEHEVPLILILPRDHEDEHVVEEHHVDFEGLGPLCLVDLAPELLRLQEEEHLLLHKLP
mmetsp:Transcript_8661/g.21330  ORF Transcript_8661/g.21330 Transcript_8661/m.21330 type:complete len:349 (+) Transcript_8661:625-1671(+)